MEMRNAILKELHFKLLHQMKFADYLLSPNEQQLLENSVNFNRMDEALADSGVMEQIYKQFTLRQEKCNEKSEKLRMLGNEKYAKKIYFEALHYYNKSICFGKLHSENIAIGYANRSAVFFELQLYRQCLENIALAREAKYPAHLLHKLNERELKCKQSLEHQTPEKPTLDFKLSFKAHAKCPYVAECVELCESQEQGRYWRTTRALKVGQVIAIEEPFCAILDTEMRYMRCEHCKLDNHLTLIPCVHCCSVMYCSAECRERAWNIYHKYDCCIIDILNNFFYPTELMALRILLTAIAEFATIEQLMAFCADPNNKQKNAFDLNYKNFSAREHYRAIRGLKMHELNPFCSLMKSFPILKYLIFEKTPLKAYVGNNVEAQNLLANLLLHHVPILKLNMFVNRSFDNSQNNDKAYSPVSYEILAAFSLINHSCAPNTMKITSPSKGYLFVTHPIAAGGEISIRSGGSFKTSPLEQRRAHLQEQHRFVCKCIACVQDYPLEIHLKSVTGVPCVEEPAGLNSLLHSNYDYALANYQRYCDFLEHYAKTYPCLQTVQAEKYLSVALNILIQPMSLKTAISVKYHDYCEPLDLLAERLQSTASLR